MKSFLARRWFLLLLVVGVTLAVLRPEWFSSITALIQPRVIVTLALSLMALNLDSHSLRQALRRPLPALWAVAISYGALPLLALLTGKLMPSEDLRIGLMITASVPCTLASAVLWTRMAGGNEATALLVIMLTTCTSWLATPPWLVFSTGIQVDVQVGELMRDLLLLVVLPVAAAQLLRGIGPVGRTVTRFRLSLGIVSQLLVFSVILKASVEASQSLRQSSTETPFNELMTALGLCLGTHLIALAAGLWTSRLWRFDRENRIAIAFACSQKTLPVAILLFNDYFKSNYPLAILPLLFYHVGQLIVDTFIADALQHRKPHLPEFPSEAEV